MSTLLAQIADLPWIGIIAIVGGMLLAAIVIVGGLIFAHRRQALWHETARIALERGQPLPPLPDTHEDPAEPARGSARDLRSGLISLGTGIGLFLFLDAMLGRWMAWVGAIPGFVGLALLIFGGVSLLLERRGRGPSDRPPQS